MIKELAFIKQTIEAKYKSLTMTKSEVSEKENIINKITQIKSWINNWPIKFFSHILKIQEDWSKANERKANGEIKNKIFIKIKRTE